jgi:hypothetical protein
MEPTPKEVTLALALEHLIEAGDKLFELMPQRTSVWDIFSPRRTDEMQTAMLHWVNAEADAKRALKL